MKVETQRDVGMLTVPHRQTANARPLLGTYLLDESWGDLSAPGGGELGTEGDEDCGEDTDECSQLGKGSLGGRLRFPRLS